jgi:hypothetical protein
MSTMQNLKALLLGMFMLLFACQGGMDQYDHCYQGDTGRDKQSIAYDLTGDQLKGVMEVQYFNLPPQTGKLKGTLRGDTLDGEFIYEQDEQMIYRQVIFLRQNDQWVEGIGELHEVDGKQVFNNMNALNFSHPLTLKKGACND